MGLTLCWWPGKAPKKGPAAPSSLAVERRAPEMGQAQLPAEGQPGPQCQRPWGGCRVALSQPSAELLLRAAPHWGDYWIQGHTIKTKVPPSPFSHLCLCTVPPALQIIPEFASKFTFWQPGHSYFVFSQNGTAALNNFWLTPHSSSGFMSSSVGEILNSNQCDWIGFHFKFINVSYLV